MSPQCVEKGTGRGGVSADDYEEDDDGVDHRRMMRRMMRMVGRMMRRMMWTLRRMMGE